MTPNPEDVELERQKALELNEIKESIRPYWEELVDGLRSDDQDYAEDCLQYTAEWVAQDRQATRSKVLKEVLEQGKEDWQPENTPSLKAYERGRNGCNRAWRYMLKAMQKEAE